MKKIFITIRSFFTVFNCKTKITDTSRSPIYKLIKNMTPQAIISVSIVVVLLPIIIVISVLSKPNKSNNNEYYHNLKCEWCGKVEDTKLYTATVIDGYNKDGSIKYKFVTVRLSDECYEKATKDGMKHKWVSIKAPD